MLLQQVTWLPGVCCIKIVNSEKLLKERMFEKFIIVFIIKHIHIYNIVEEKLTALHITITTDE